MNAKNSQASIYPETEAHFTFISERNKVYLCSHLSQAENSMHKKTMHVILAMEFFERTHFLGT